MAIIYEALVAQSVERQAVNLQVDCSNQSWGEFFFSNKKNQYIFCAIKYSTKKYFQDYIDKIGLNWHNFCCEKNDEKLTLVESIFVI